MSQKFFTERNVKALLRLWPQAVSMDEGDLEILRAMCDPQKRGGRKALRWADYLWLDLLDDFAAAEMSPDAYRVEAFLSDTRGDGSVASFWSNRYKLNVSLPKTGYYRLSGMPLCVIELKVVEADLCLKFESAFRKAGRWSQEVLKILAHQWQSKLREADRQIGDSRLLLQCPTARGIVILLQSGPTSVNQAVVSGYMYPELGRLKNIDAIFYLANALDGRPLPPFIVPRVLDDPAVTRFAAQFVCMIQGSRLDNSGRIIIRGRQPSVIAQITVDAETRAALRRDWREAIEARNELNLEIRFQKRAQYRSGLAFNE